MHTGVIDIPQLRALVLRVPLMELIAEREDTFLRTALLLVTTGAAESGVELIFIQGMKQGLRLHQVRMHLASMRERAHARVESLHIRLHDQVPAEFFA